jgi:hypothetical protein
MQMRNKSWLLLFLPLFMACTDVNVGSGVEVDTCQNTGESGDCSDDHNESDNSDNSDNSETTDTTD